MQIKRHVLPAFWLAFSLVIDASASEQQNAEGLNIIMGIFGKIIEHKQQKDQQRLQREQQRYQQQQQ